MTKSIHRRSLPGDLQLSNPFACGLTGVLLALCLWLVPAVLPVNAAPGGTVVAWGLNEEGQTTVPAGLSGVTAIAGGYAHTVALKNDGTVVAWGWNGYGQTTVPVGLSGVTAIAAGDRHTVALRDDGTVLAWGYNASGQTTVPAGLGGVTAIAAGGHHTVALRFDGKVVAWGYNGHGEINVPVGLSGVTSIAAGIFHTVALKSDGTVVAWGLNDNGQTTGTPSPSPYIATANPVTLNGQTLGGVTAIAAGGHNTVALLSDGTVVCWGRTFEGQTTVPSGLSGVMAVAAGGQFTVALKSDGTVVKWGRNFEGQPIVPAGLTGVTAIAAGNHHTVALVEAATPPNGAPVANCKNVTVSAGANCSANASINDGSFDPDATDMITVTQTPAGPYPVGVTQVTLTVTDNHGASASCTAAVTVVAPPPVITQAAANLTVECDGAGNTASLNAWLASHGGATAADACSPVTWTHNFTDLSDGCGETGSATVTFTATNASGNSRSTTATFAIIDTTAPALTWKANNVVVDPALVFNITPNHVPVTNSVSAVDICGPAFLNPLRVTCHAINGAGKVVDKSGSCVINISGGTVTIIDSGGVGTFITIFASAIDECGNSTGEKKLVIEVKNPGAGGGGNNGNEGVGNGVDGNTPGNANNGGNDDTGSSPGNPGAKNKD